LVVIDMLMAQQARQSARSLLPPLKATLPPKATTVGGQAAVDKLERNQEVAMGVSKLV
jgi:chorismate synthase